MSSSRAKACSANLKQIQSALQQYSMDNKLAAGSTVSAWTDALVGSTAYIKSTPACPAGGAYTVDTIDNPPTCSSNTVDYPHTYTGS